MGNFSPSATGISGQVTLDNHKEKHDYKYAADNKETVQVATGIINIITIII